MASVETLLELLQKNQTRTEAIKKIICNIPVSSMRMFSLTGYPVTSGVIPESSARYILAVTANKREEIIYSTELLTEASLRAPAAHGSI